MSEAAGTEQSSEGHLPQPRLVAARGGDAQLISEIPLTKRWKTHFCGRPCIVQQWTSNTYNTPVLGRKLNGSPVQQEVRGMLRARKLGVHTPVPYLVELDTNSVCTAELPGTLLRDLLKDDAVQSGAFMAALAGSLALMHDGGFVHGGLDTSSMLVVRDTKQDDGGSCPTLALLGWSTSFNSMLPEDKALDLQALEEGLMKDHPNRPDLFDQFMATYKRKSKQWSAVHNKLAAVKKRNKQQEQPTAAEDQGPSKKQKVSQS